MQSVRELFASYRRVTVDLPHIGRAITEPDEAMDVVRALIGDAAHERFVVLHLDAKNRIRSFTTVGVGDVAACPVSVTELFKSALLANSAAVLVGHNHPSGNPQPSPEDLALTARIRRVGELLGIPLLDHVIVGDPDGFSFAREGVLEVGGD